EEHRLIRLVLHHGHRPRRPHAPVPEIAQHDRIALPEPLHPRTVLTAGRPEEHTRTHVRYTYRATSRYRKQVVTWSLTMPTACMPARQMVGPTNRHPRRSRPLLTAFESGVRAASSATRSQRLPMRPPTTETP